MPSSSEQSDPAFDYDTKWYGTQNQVAPTPEEMAEYGWNDDDPEDFTEPHRPSYNDDALTDVQAGYGDDVFGATEDVSVIVVPDERKMD